MHGDNLLIVYTNLSLFILVSMLDFYTSEVVAIKRFTTSNFLSKQFEILTSAFKNLFAFISLRRQRVVSIDVFLKIILTHFLAFLSLHLIIIDQQFSIYIVLATLAISNYLLVISSPVKSRVQNFDYALTNLTYRVLLSMLILLSLNSFARAHWSLILFLLAVIAINLKFEGRKNSVLVSFFNQFIILFLSVVFYSMTGIFITGIYAVDIFILALICILFKNLIFRLQIYTSEKTKSLISKSEILLTFNIGLILCLIILLLT